MKRPEVALLLGPYHPYALNFVQGLRNKYGLASVAIARSLEAKTYQAPKLRAIESYLEELYYLECYSLEKLIHKIQLKYQVKALIPLSEFDVHLAKRILKIQHLSWLHPDILDRFTSKSTLKTYLRSQDQKIKLNHQRLVHNVKDVKRYRSEFGQHFVLKPDQGTFSVDVSAFNGHDWKLVEEYFARIPHTTFIMEDFIEPKVPGQEFIVNGQTTHLGEVVVYSVGQYTKVDGPKRTFLYSNETFLKTTHPEFKSLIAYATEVIKLSGLSRSPFHMEIIIDRQDDKPCLVEVGARLPGGSSAFAINDVHSTGGRWSTRDKGFDIFDLALHYYVHVKPYQGPDMQWLCYDQNYFLAVTGISTKKERIFNVEGIDQVKKLPSFRRFSLPLWRGRKLDITTSLATAPYEFHLMSTRSEEELKQDEKLGRKWIKWNQNVTLSQKFHVYKMLVFLRLRFILNVIKSRMQRVFLPKTGHKHLSPFKREGQISFKVVKKQRWYSFKEFMTIKHWEKEVFQIDLTYWQLFDMLVQKAPITFFVYDQKRIAGYGICDLSGSRNCLWVKSFVVTSEYRGLRVGQQMIKAAEMEQGISEIRGLVREDNEVARTLYLKMGYQESGIEPKYYPDGTDGVVVIKKIA